MPRVAGGLVQLTKWYPAQPGGLADRYHVIWRNRYESRLDRPKRHLACGRNDFQGAVIVTVIAMRVVEVPFDQVIGVVTVRNRLVSAITAVLMTLVVATAVMIGCTGRRILRGNADLVLVNVPLVFVVEMPIMKVILMAFVRYNRVAAIRPMDVVMRIVDLMFSAHLSSPFLGTRKRYRPIKCGYLPIRAITDETKSGLMRQPSFP